MKRACLNSILDIYKDMRREDRVQDMRRTIEFAKKTKIILADDNFDHLMGIRELINIKTDFEKLGLG